MSLLRGSARIRKEDSNQSAVPSGQMGGLEKGTGGRQAGFVPERRVCSWCPLFPAEALSIPGTCPSLALGSASGLSLRDLISQELKKFHMSLEDERS